MGRSIRGPVAHRLVEVTTRTLGSRYLLRPSEPVNAVILGVLGRAQRRYGMKVCAVVAMSSHMHLLLRPTDSYQMARFMAYVNSNIAKKIGVLHRWNGRFWGRRYQAIPVSDEANVQIQRLRYILRHGVKEGIVSHPAFWPGVQVVSELCTGGNEVSGTWFLDSDLRRLKLRGRSTGNHKVQRTPEILKLSPLPCWDHLPEEERATEAQRLVDDIEQTARHSQVQFSGSRSVLRLHPHRSPRKENKKPAPWFHASTTMAAKMREAYKNFVENYRLAAKRLREGNHHVSFPYESFPPPFPRPAPLTISG